MRTYTPVVTQELTKLTCDGCGLSADKDERPMEFSEFLSHRATGGYGSVFGDGSLVEVDLCQRCVRDILGRFVRVTPPEPYGAEEPEGESPQADAGDGGDMDD